MPIGLIGNVPFNPPNMAIEQRRPEQVCSKMLLVVTPYWDEVVIEIVVFRLAMNSNRCVIEAIDDDANVIFVENCIAHLC